MIPQKREMYLTCYNLHKLGETDLEILWWNHLPKMVWRLCLAFSNIQFICLSGCGYPSSLPPLGQLPVMQELTIKSMKSVMTVGVEFYSCNGSSVFRPFQSLKKLKFDEMPEWEEWLPSPGGGNSLDFARLEKLILRKCSKLRGNLHNHLRSMKKLSCPVVRFCTKG